jgi:hypothetical protein
MPEIAALRREIADVRAEFITKLRQAKVDFDQVRHVNRLKQVEAPSIISATTASKAGCNETSPNQSQARRGTLSPDGRARPARTRRRLVALDTNGRSALATLLATLNRSQPPPKPPTPTRTGNVIRLR